MTGLTITDYHTGHQEGVDAMLLDIAGEYAEEIFSPAYKKISEVCHLTDRRYWTALADGQVAGTAGMIIAGGGYGVLKAMFVHKDYRGSERQTAQRLLQTAEDWAREQGCKAVWLGTMAQFVAAQRFYEKNGYVRMGAAALPEGFPMNDVDTVFLMKEI